MFLKGLIPILFIVFLFSSCRKDQSILKDPGTLNFSEDTVYFDTVFTRLPGSAYPRSINKRFMIRNPYKETVNVNARLMGGSNSVYRMNIDGQSGTSFSAIELMPKDSAWVFVEATLEPNSLTQPALVRDSIEFETNGNIQYVQLAAYGWDAYYFKDTVFTANTSLILFDKPYVIVNSAFVEKGVTLTIGPNLHFYSTPNSGFKDNNGKIFNISALNVFGTLKINGTKNSPVIFEGDRLDNLYANKPGQWRGIHFYRGSVNNEITHAIIKNSTIGLWVDSLPENANPGLIVRNTIIKNMSAYGILGLTARIYVENSVISNCGSNTLIGYYGGDYTLIHCSLHSGASGRRDPHVIFNNILRNENKVILKKYKLSYGFANTIIWGPLESEMGFDVDPDSVGRALDSNLIKSKVPIGVAGNYSKDPKFIDPDKGNLKLKPDSPAKDKGRKGLGILFDLEEKLRDALPDIGAYEL